MLGDVPTLHRHMIRTPLQLASEHGTHLEMPSGREASGSVLDWDNYILSSKEMDVSKSRIGLLKALLLNL